MNPNSDDNISSLEFDENSQNKTPTDQTNGGINLQQYNHLFMQPPTHGSHSAGMIDPSPLIANDSIGNSLGHPVSHDADGAAGLNEQELTGLPDRNNPEKSTPSWHHPVESTRNYFRDISSYFTPKFLSWMAISQFCVNGGIFTLVMSLSLPIFQQLGVSASRQQLYTTMMLSPWGEEMRMNSTLLILYVLISSLISIISFDINIPWWIQQ